MTNSTDHTALMTIAEDLRHLTDRGDLSVQQLRDRLGDGFAKLDDDGKRQIVAQLIATLERQIAGEAAAEAVEADPELRKIVCRKKDLNAKGNGTQETRRVRLPNGSSGWASDLAEDVSGSWESGSYLASQRRCSESGYFPVGTVVVAYDSTLSGGNKTGRASVNAGVVVSTERGREVRSGRGVNDDSSDSIEWCLSTRRKGKEIEVKLPSGEWVSV